jgi:hypothetical protein
MTSDTDTILRDGKRVLLLAPVGAAALPQDPLSGVTR